MIPRRLLALAAAAAALIAAGATSGRSAAARELYVDPSAGDDAAAGTLQAPWRTLRRGVQDLQAGDTLLLRGGVYRESAIRITAQGTAAEPIQIRAQPGEIPVVDGGLGEFRSAGNQDWEPVDAERLIFRSSQVYPQLEGVHAYLQHGGREYHLVPYSRLEDLVSDNEVFGLGALYVGQGALWNPADARIYIRLRPPLLQGLQNLPDPPPLDPRSAAIHVVPQGELITLDAAAHVVLDGLVLRYRTLALELTGATHHVTVRNTRILGGAYHVVVRDGSHHLTFENIQIRDSIPPWVAWTDVKSGSQPPAAAHQGAGIEINGTTHDIEVRGSQFIGVWDGIDVFHDSHQIELHHNLFQDIRDDAIELGTAGHHHHVHRNRMTGVLAAVSFAGTGATPEPGTTWIHHNVIDGSRQTQFFRPGSNTQSLQADPIGRVWAAPFGDHNSQDIGEGDVWRIYNNTILFGADLYREGAGHTRQRRTGSIHGVGNNIFVQVADQWVARGATVVDGLQIYNGNLYFRSAPDPQTPLFLEYVDAQGNETSFARLSDFIGSSFWLQTQSFYPTGWETNSVEMDPELDAEYRPSLAAASGAVELPPELPGSAELNFRGALLPRGAQGTQPSEAPAPPDPPLLLP